MDSFEMTDQNKPKLNIQLDEWMYNCGDGCCTNYGTTVKVNGESMPLNNQDTGTILQQVLEHLGYEVEIVETYNDDLE
jgi:hypothetical protein